MKIAIYTRVSSEDQATNGYSLEAQREKIECVIAATPDYEYNPVHFFTDEGVSGVKSIDERPGLRRLFEAASRREFDLVLVYKVDRLFRKTKLLLEAVEKLGELGIGLKSITEAFDTSNPMGRFMLSTLGSVAELERENIMDRMEMGKEKAARAGTWMGGGVPFGYFLDSESKRLKIDESEAEVVRMFYKWLVEEGISVHSIQKRINTLNIPTRYDRIGRQKPTKTQNWWRVRTIARILTNSVYTGEFIFRRKKDPARAEYPENYNPKELTIVQQVPQIIDPEVFNEAERRLRVNQERSGRNTKNPYLFNKLIHCGECGKKWSAMTKKTKLLNGEVNNHKYYYCNSKFAPYICNQRRVKEGAFDEAVWGKLLDVISRPDVVYKEIEDRVKKAGNFEELKKEIQFIGGELRLEQKKSQRLVEVYISGDLEKAVFEDRKKHIDQVIETLEQKLTSLKALTKELPTPIMFRRSIKAIYDRYIRRIYSLSYADRAFIIHQIVEDIEYAFGEASITLKLPCSALRDQQGVGGALQPVQRDSGDGRVEAG